MNRMGFKLAIAAVLLIGCAGTAKATQTASLPVETGLATAASTLAIATQVASTPPSPAAPRLVAYYASWSIYEPQYYVTDIPGDKLTDLIYAFVNISDQGECALGDLVADIQFQYKGDQANQPVRGNLNQLQLLKLRFPHLAVLISVGGLTWSGRFSDVALTDASRQRFAQTCVNFMRQYGFDGIDIDWEFPVAGGLTPGRAQDKANLTLLLAELRQALDAQGQIDAKTYRLTIAAPAMPADYNHFDLGQIAPLVDWINLMAYAYHAGWGPVAHHQAPLYYAPDDPSPPESTRPLNIDATVTAYLAAGVPPEKIVVGVPFYGQGWAGASGANNGLYQPFSALPDGTRGQGIYDYDALVDPRFQRLWDDNAKVPWLYDNAAQIMITYENPDSLAGKAQYVLSRQLGGMMIWELSFDDDQHSLLTALAENLGVSP